MRKKSRGRSQPGPHNPVGPRLRVSAGIPAGDPRNPPGPRRGPSFLIGVSPKRLRVDSGASLGSKMLIKTKKIKRGGVEVTIHPEKHKNNTGKIYGAAPENRGAGIVSPDG